MEEIIGVSLIEGLIDAFGGSAAIAGTAMTAITTILDFLGPTGFEAIQTLMKAFSNSELYTLLGNLVEQVENGVLTLQGGFNTLKGMSAADFLGHINIISQKLITKGINLTTNSGKQLFLDLVDQVRNMSSSTAFNIAGGAIGIGTGAYNIIKSKDHDVTQNDNKVDYNLSNKLGTLGGSSTNNI